MQNSSTACMHVPTSLHLSSVLVSSASIQYHRKGCKLHSSAVLASQAKAGIVGSGSVMGMERANRNYTKVPSAGRSHTPAPPEGTPLGPFTRFMSWSVMTSTTLLQCATSHCPGTKERHFQVNNL
eukprot:3661473-Amphidinium_carterae.1